MLILGIECTAHSFGIGIIKVKGNVNYISEKNILFSEKSVFQSENSGMDLRKLTEFHTKNFDSILVQAKIYLNSINKNFEDIDLISFSQGPGLGNSLKIATLVAKTLSLKYNIKIIGVNHIRSHLEIGKTLTGAKDPIFLNITGVNSQVIAKSENNNYKVYGETDDIGLGNLFDNVARQFKLGFPGGPEIEKLAKNGKKYISFPYTLKGMNISLAGINSFVKQQLLKGETKEDLSYSLQETVFAMIMEIAERAMAYTNKKELVIVGGVASNQRFVEMAKSMCKIRKAKYLATPLKYCMDNGAMIAWLGYLERDRSELFKNIKTLQSKPYITIETEL